MCVYICIYIYVYIVSDIRLRLGDAVCYCCCSFSLLFFLFCLYRRGIYNNRRSGKSFDPSFDIPPFILARCTRNSFTEGARALATQSDGTVGRKKLESLPREKLNVDHGGVMCVFMCVYVCVQYAVLLGAFRLSNNYRCTIYIYIHIYM